MGAILSFSQARCSCALSLTKNEDSLKKPISKFPTLLDLTFLGKGNIFLIPYEALHFYHTKSLSSGVCQIWKQLFIFDSYIPIFHQVKSSMFSSALPNWHRCTNCNMPSKKIKYVRRNFFPLRSWINHPTSPVLKYVFLLYKHC